MNVIDFKPAKCSHCYRCVRTCHVKAITVKDQQAQIIADSCIYCGDCLNECPQDAKIYLSDLHKVKTWIAADVPIAVSWRRPIGACSISMNPDKSLMR